MNLIDFSFKTVNINFGLDQATLPDCFHSSYLYKFFHVTDFLEVDHIIVFFYTYVFNHSHIVHVCYTSVVYLIAKRALVVSQNFFQCKQTLNTKKVYTLQGLEQLYCPFEITNFSCDIYSFSFCFLMSYYV